MTTADYDLQNAWTGHVLGSQREFPSDDPAAIEIWAYSDRMSYSPGDRVCLHVHCTGPRHDLVVFRDGHTRDSVHRREGLVAKRQSTRADAHALGCGWEVTYEFEVGADWRSGVYVIELSTVGADGSQASAEHFFVVRPQRPQAALALVLATSTYTAYNDWGGGNSYRTIVGGTATDTIAPTLSLERPWPRGFAKLPPAAPRHKDAPVLERGARPTYPWLDWALNNGFSRHYADAGWAYYERPFSHWMERQGFEIDYYTQHDLHFEPERFKGYRGVVSVGHDEYWSWEMRDTIESVLNRGGHYARFGGNMLWQVRLENEGRTQVCHKVPNGDPRSASDDPSRTTTYWDSRIVSRPATSTFGLTGLAGVYNRFGAAAPRASGGLTVYRPDHWAFNDTDLYYGDLLGAGAAQIACFEVDGADYTFRGGLPFITGIDGAPQSMSILALTPAVRGEVWRHGGPLNAPLSDVKFILEAAPAMYEVAEYGVGMMGVLERDSSVMFNAGMTEWVSGLIVEDPVIETVTRNVLLRVMA